MHYIKVFDSLRGIMALWVAIIHTLMSINIQPSASLNKILSVTYSVDIFIILSGFVIFFAINNKPESYKKYITRRAFRIFPVYLFALAISALTIDLQIFLWQSLGQQGNYWTGRLSTLQSSSEYFYTHLITHVFLLQGIFDGIIKHSDFAFIEPAWSLSLEWQFYLIAPLIFTAISSDKVNFKIIIGLSILCSAMYGLAGSGFLPNRFHYFGVGIASFYIYKAHQENKNILLPALILCMGLILRNIPITIWAFFLCIATYRTFGTNIFKKILEADVFQNLGKISYPIYVLHTLAIYPAIFLNNKFNYTGAYNRDLVIIFVTLAITFGAAIGTHVLLEKPAMRFGKKLADRF